MIIVEKDNAIISWGYPTTR